MHFGGKLLVLGMRELSETAENLKVFPGKSRNHYLGDYDGYELVGGEKAKNRLKKAGNRCKKAKSSGKMTDRKSRVFGAAWSEL